MKKKFIIGSAILIVVIAAIVIAFMLLTNKKIIITFDTDGANVINAIKIKKGGSIYLPAVEKEGFILDGWYLDNQRVTNSTTYDKNVTLKAKWISEEAKTFTITFDSDGGSKVDNLVVECGKELSLPANPTKEGYTFVSWIDKFETPILDKALLSCEDVTLKANWKKEESKPSSEPKPSSSAKPSSSSKEKKYKCPEGYTLDGTKCVSEKKVKEKCPADTKEISGICATITYAARKDYSKACKKAHVTYKSFSDEVDGKLVNWGITGCAYYKTSDSDKSTCESHGFKWVTPESACYVKWDTTTVTRTCSHLNGYVDIPNPNDYISNTGLNSGCFPTKSKEKYCADTTYKLTNGKCIKTIDATLE